MSLKEEGGTKKEEMATEQSQGLPEGWETATLGDVLLDIVGGGTPPRNVPAYFDGSIPWFTVKDMKSLRPRDAEEHITEEAINNSATNLIPANTLILATRIALGRAMRPLVDCAINQDLKALTLGEGVEPDFFLYWVGAHERAIQDLGSGTTVSGIRLETLRSLSVLLPPSAEQTRIVEKLEELLSDLDAGVAELKAAQQKLAQYRQSLLKAAVEGDLTADWRRARGLPPLPNPSPTRGEGLESTARCAARAEKLESAPFATREGLESLAPLSPCGRGAGGEGKAREEGPNATLTLARARELRQKQTPHEQTLWRHLRAKRFDGFKFRRQQPIGHFIVDFVCFSQQLIIELDGGGHADRQDYDAKRDAWLRSQGFRILRFWNNQLAEQPEAVLEAIWNALRATPPLPNPSPTRGEGLGERGQTETGAELLSRILKERRARWEAKQLEKFASQGKAPPQNWQNKYPEPTPPDTQNLPALPEGWVWASVDQIGEVFLGKMLDKSKHTTGKELPYFRNVNVRWGEIDVGDVKEMFFDDDELERYGLLEGDVLVCEGGEPGRAAVCKKEHESFKYQKALHRVRLFGFYEPYLFISILETLSKSGRLAKEFTGSTINHFTKESFVALSIPLPPLVEQKEIVSKIHAQVDEIFEQLMRIDFSLKQTIAQRQNILRAAFAGELVPQDPSDEPASALLERIRAQRAAQAPAKKPRGRKKKEIQNV